MMFTGRILIVSDRRDVIAELEPIIRAGQHLASVVPDGQEALHALEDGLVPDVMISDLGCERSYDHIAYVRRFRELNGAGCHLVVTEPGAPFSGPGRAVNDRFAVLPRPFDTARVSTQLEDALRRVEQDFRALRAEMWRSMDRLKREVEDARGEMVQALARTIGARDVYMHGHCERVGDMCRKIALVLNLSDERTHLLSTAAQLHELGKISVPVELLHKTEPLDAGELERIRGHFKVGAEIVRGVPSLQPLAAVIEHLGTDHADLATHVPPDAPEYLLIGILRVVDVWDAMNHPRAYRPAMPRGYWEPLLQGGAEDRFHPAAVAALFRVLGA